MTYQRDSSKQRVRFKSSIQLLLEVVMWQHMNKQYIRSIQIKRQQQNQGKNSCIANMQTYVMHMKRCYNIVQSLCKHAHTKRGEKKKRGGRALTDLARARQITSIASFQLICKIEAMLLHWGLEDSTSISNHHESTVSQINGM